MRFPCCTCAAAGHASVHVESAPWAACCCHACVAVKQPTGGAPRRKKMPLWRKGRPMPAHATKKRSSSSSSSVLLQLAARARRRSHACVGRNTAGRRAKESERRVQGYERGVCGKPSLVASATQTRTSALSRAARHAHKRHAASGSSAHCDWQAPQSRLRQYDSKRIRETRHVKAAGGTPAMTTVVQPRVVAIIRWQALARDVSRALFMHVPRAALRRRHRA
jgi:hypothetical protein